MADVGDSLVSFVHGERSSGFSARRLARLGLRWGPALGCAGLIFYLSHQSLSDDDVPVPDYVGHLIGYFGLGAALVWGYSEMLRRPFTLRQAALVWWWSSLYGLTDEFHQSFIPLRNPSLDDVLVDSGAALLAAALGWTLLRSRGQD